MENEITKFDGGVTFSGPKAVDVFVCVMLAGALELYAKTGMKVNSAYTPTAMLRKANQLTGHVYRRGQYSTAALALRELADRTRREIQFET